MPDSLYEKHSDKIKLLSLVLVPVFGAGAKFFADPVLQQACVALSAMSAMTLILMVSLEKIHREIATGFATLTEKLRANFAYHGLSDVIKERFTATERL